MKTKIKFLARLLLLAVFALFTNCEANKDIIEESALENHTPAILSQKISFKQSKHFTTLDSEIKSIQTKFNKTQTSKAEQKQTDSLKILTDEVLYVTYAGTHTYTFKVVRKNPIYLLENIVLHYNLRTKSYDEYLMQYKDLKEQDIKEISTGKLFQDSKKVIVTKLENGFFESHSSSNKASSTSKASSVICTTATSTVWVDCSQGVHHQGNIGEWYKCEAAVRPLAYQSTSTTCTVTSSPTPIPQETTDPSAGGGGNNPDVVVYNPLPLEPCDNSDEVDLNGNCIQPIDVAVSLIANCLSSNYSTILNQSEINFLHSTTSSFQIKNYLQNNGCSSESSLFAKEMINYMRQNTLNSDAATTELFFKTLGATNNFQDNITESFVQDNISYFSQDVQNQILIDPLLAVQIAQEYLIQRAVKKYLHPDLNEVEIYYSVLWDLRHMALDAFGLIPVFGEVADLVNGVLYTIEGDKVNAAFSFASTVPVAGWAATGVKYSLKVVNTAYDINTKVKLVWKVLPNNNLFFGTNDYCRKQLRKVLGMTVGNGLQAHHIIPLNLQTNPIVQKAAKSGNAFHMNEALNGIPLSTAVHSGSHGNYDGKILQKLQDFAEANPNATPKQCYNEVVDIINDIRTAIQTNRTTPINQLNF